MLEQLPFNNEVCKTVLMRPDAKSVTQELIKVLRGQQDWSQIAWVFTEDLELFKNIVSRSHGLTSAICYSVDLGSGGEVIIDRIQVINAPDRFTGHYDGRFIIAPGRQVLVKTWSFSIRNLHG